MLTFLAIAVTVAVVFTLVGIVWDVIVLWKA